MRKINIKHGEPKCGAKENEELDNIPNVMRHGFELRTDEYGGQKCANSVKVLKAIYACKTKVTAKCY